MPLLVISASFLLVIIVCIICKSLYALSRTIFRLQSVDPSNPFSDCLLQAATLQCHQWRLMPTLFKVYFLGVIETVHITLFRRGLFGSSLKRDKHENLVDDILDIKNFENLPIAVIVGADSGIGIEICRGLLKSGFRVIVGSRSMKACQKTLSSIEKSTGSDKLRVLEVDFTSFQSVRKFAEQLKPQLAGQSIRLLINNAGVMNTPYTKTIDGYESQCQINYLAPILLTKLLLPFVDKTDGRILFASSSTLYAISNLNTDMPLKKYGLNGLDHYAYSKACIAQLAKYLSRHTAAQIKVFAYHPGTVRTKLFQYTTIFTLPCLSRIFNLIMLTPKEGAETPLYLCLTKDIDGSGTYWANKHSYPIPSAIINHVQNGIDLLWKDTMLKCGLSPDDF